MSIEQFLRNIQPFENGNLQEFLRELHQVPDLEAKFAELIQRNPGWVAEATRTKKEDGYHVYFLLDYQKSVTFDNKPTENEICLRSFHLGDNTPAPTIKVLSKSRALPGNCPFRK